VILTLQDIAQAQRFHAAGHWRDETLYDLLRAGAGRHPDHPFLRDAASRLSWGEALRWVEAIAVDLDGAGLRVGDRVSIWLPSRVESALILLACSRNGYVCNVSLHRDHTTPEVIGLLGQVGASALFLQPGYGADGLSRDVDHWRMQLPKLRHIRSLPPVGARGPSIGLEAGGLSLSAIPPPSAGQPDRVMYLAFTSGTTGAAKGVLHSDNTLLANARAMVRDWSFTAETVVFALGPMSHNMGTVCLATTLSCGGELVVGGPADPATTLDRILDSGATYLVGVPTHAIDLLAEARRRGLQSLGRAGVFQLAGSPIPAWVAEQLQRLGVAPMNCYGMTENCSFQYTRPADPQEIVIGTCGRSCDGFELRIWAQDDPDRELALGEVGELGCRGACLMLGYFGDQTNTESSFNRHGWFMTGDLGCLDATGNLLIVGRKKDLIIRGGHNIHPARIEDLAMRHDAVLKAAVFPVADERLGEKVCMAVVVREAGSLDGAALLAHLHAQGLSRYEMPEWFVTLDALPLTASGKVLKRQLVQWVREGALRPDPVRWQPPSKAPARNEATADRI
jgi:acyl-CoA synthetase